MFTVLGSADECGPTGCSTFSWGSGTLVGNQLTLLTDATSANDYESYELIVDLTSDGKSLAGNLTRGAAGTARSVAFLSAPVTALPHARTRVAARLRRPPMS